MDGIDEGKGSGSTGRKEEDQGRKSKKKEQISGGSIDFVDIWVKKGRSPFKKLKKRNGERRVPTTQTREVARGKKCGLSMSSTSISGNLVTQWAQRTSTPLNK